MKINFISKLLISSLFIAVISINAYADEDFSTDYNISYNIDNSGTAQVTHIVTITNLKKDVIATNYKLGLNKLDIFDINAFDENGKIEVNQTNDGESINLDMRLQNFVIGEGRQNVITIKYKSKLIASKSGEVWNVNIPRAQAATQSTTYHISLTVPNTIGPKIFMAPAPSTEQSDMTTTTYYFSDEATKTKNISAAFGRFQVLNFRLKYQIQNPNMFTSNFEIALPPDVPNVQSVIYESLTEKPSRTYMDPDGNYMAVYKLKPKQQMEIMLTGQAHLTSRQIAMNNSQEMEKLPKEIASKYIRKQTYWESENVNIKEIAKTLYNKDLNVAQNANKIYDFLISNYSYDFEIAKKDYVDRKGALKALNEKDGWGCMEFTDTFIAIARSMGIPAREINGYALNTIENTKPISLTLKSGDQLHAWPEFYDPSYGWVQIDPTWGDTSNTDYFSKMDTNHFVFVIKGLDSMYPLPAGTYRDNTNQRLVEVEFAENDETKNNNSTNYSFTAEKIANLNPVQIINGRIKVLIKNTGKAIMYYDKTSILPQEQKSVYIDKNKTTIELTDALNNEYSQKITN